MKDHIITDANVKIVETERDDYDLGSFTGKKDKLLPLFKKLK